MQPRTNIQEAIEIMLERLAEQTKNRGFEKEFEPVLEVWNCKNCGCECAGRSALQLCADCESLTPEQRGEDK